MTTAPGLHRPRVDQSKVFLLVSPLYVAAVGTLLLNDFVLKRAWPGLVTGKLSDFAGLFALGVFLLVLTRSRAALLGLAAAFVLWKLPTSEVLIQAWNLATGLNIGRTVDGTDLLALAVLPLAWWFYRSSVTPQSLRRGWCILSSGVSLFAFTATSRAMNAEQRAAFHAEVAEFEFTDNQPNYHLALGRQEFYRALEARQITVSGVEVAPRFGQHNAYITPRGNHSLRSASGAPELLGASFLVDNAAGGITLRLTKVSVKKASRPVSQADAARLFEATVVAPVR